MGSAVPGPTCLDRPDRRVLLRRTASASPTISETARPTDRHAVQIPRRPRSPARPRHPVRAEMRRNSRRAEAYERVKLAGHGNSAPYAGYEVPWPVRSAFSVVSSKMRELSDPRIVMPWRLWSESQLTLAMNGTSLIGTWRLPSCSAIPRRRTTSVPERGFASRRSWSHREAVGSQSHSTDESVRGCWFILPEHGL